MNKRIILYSLVACLSGTVIGYFCLFTGGHISHNTDKFSLILVPGYILMWPSLLYGYAQSSITGNSVISYTSGAIAQVLGYIIMGYLIYYAYKLNNT